MDDPVIPEQVDRYAEEMARELGVEVVLGPILREADGLAMSSRNALLPPDARRDAVGLFRALGEVQGAFEAGERSAGILQEFLGAEMNRHQGLRLQYGEIVHPDTLEPMDPALPGGVVAVAAHCGGTRLIDNHILTE